MLSRWIVLHLTQVGSSIDSKASRGATKRFSEESDTKGHRCLGGSRSSEGRG